MLYEINEGLPSPWVSVNEGLKVVLFPVNQEDIDSNDTATYSLNDLVTFSSDVETCGASMIQLCLNSSCDLLANIIADFTSL